MGEGRLDVSFVVRVADDVVGVADECADAVDQFVQLPLALLREELTGQSSGALQRKSLGQEGGIRAARVQRRGREFLRIDLQFDVAAAQSPRHEFGVHVRVDVRVVSVDAQDDEGLMILPACVKVLEDYRGHDGSDPADLIVAESHRRVLLHAGALRTTKTWKDFIRLTVVGRSPNLKIIHPKAPRPTMTKMPTMTSRRLWADS